MRRWPGAGLLPAALALCLLPATAAAQVGAVADESERLRHATAAEARGDLELAETLLREVLESSPGSLAALVAFERVLGTQGRPGDVLPAVERLLAVDAAASLAHQMRVRALALLGREAEMLAAAESWFAAAARSETPYREVARLLREGGQHPRAREVLERGRRAVGRPDALALELGDLYAESGDPARAVREWSRAVGPDAQGLIVVQRRLSLYPGAGGRHVRLLVDELVRPPVTPQRQRAAVQVAIDAGLGERALELARAAASALRGSELQGFLTETARRADGRGVHAVAYWAYSALLEAQPRGELLPVRARVAELALAVGDTAVAERMFGGIESALPEDSQERRLARAVRIERTARDGHVEEASREFADFTTRYAQAPESRVLAAALAEAFLERGDVAEAERLVAGVPGARAALVRARIFIHYGDIERARLAFLEAAPSLTGVEATQAIALAALLARLEPPARALVGMAFTVATEGEPAEAAALVQRESEGLPPADRAAVLDFAAAMADEADSPRLAEQIRRDIIAIRPAPREVPAAMLALARALATRPEAEDEARMLLETLVLEHGRSALAPQARRELERLGLTTIRSMQDLQ
jgi:tetratricopeptide (TPR) repeat protein